MVGPMTLILAGLVVAGFMAYVLSVYGERWFITFFSGLVLSVAVGAGAIFYAAMVWSWYAAGEKVKIVNDTFGTEYTQEQFFWGSDVIEVVRELKRQRIEVNGDLLREKE